MKKLPYWLKGGFIGSLIVVLISVYYFTFFNGGDCTSPIAKCIVGVFLTLPLLLGSVVVDSLFMSLGFGLVTPMIIIILSNIIIYFLIGSLIGLIFEKIKSAKSI